MRKEWRTLWRLITILFVLCVTFAASAQQNSTESRELQYTVTVDMQELVNIVKELTRNVSTLTDNQKELSENVKDLTKSMNNINTRMAVIEERTTWIRGLLYILLTAIVGAIITPIVLHILSNEVILSKT